MVGKVRITKEQITKEAVNLFKDTGSLDAIQARTLAKRLHCSTQPILYQFKTMDDVKKEVENQAMDIYHRYMKNITNKRLPYRDIGRNYIRFAKEEPALFQLIFMNHSQLPVRNFIEDDDDVYNDVVKSIRIQIGKSLDKQTVFDFHTRMWVYTHGIACLLATQSCDFTIEHIDELLKDQFISLIYLLIQRGKITVEELQKYFNEMKEEENKYE